MHYWLVTHQGPTTAVFKHYFILILHVVGEWVLILYAGSLSQHKSPDYSAVYVIFKTDGEASVEGHGLTFTLGRGNELGACPVRVNKLNMFFFQPVDR